MNLNAAEKNPYCYPEPDRDMKPCNMCGGRNFTTLFYKEGNRIIMCEDCDIVFMNPLTGDGLKAESSNSETSPDTESHGQKELYRLRMKLFERLVGKGRILDAGSIRSDFLKVAKSMGWEIHGVDPSVVSCFKAREVTGGNIINDTLEQVELPSDHYNVITMCNVIENLTNPLFVISKLRSHLKPGGVMVVETANNGNSNSGHQGNNCRSIMPKSQIYHFDRKTIREMLLQSGFDDIRICYGDDKIPIKIIERFEYHMFSLKGHILFTALSMGLNIFDRLKNGGKMTIYMRRPL